MRLTNMVTALWLVLLVLVVAGCPNSGTDSGGKAVDTGASNTETATPPPVTAAAPTTWTGDAKDFAFAGFDGSSGKASDFAGKPLVVNFWATW